MKITRLTLVLLAAAIALPAVSAHAQMGAPMGMVTPPTPAENLKAILDAFDANKDGILDSDELKKALDPASMNPAGTLPLVRGGRGMGRGMGGRGGAADTPTASNGNRHTQFLAKAQAGNIDLYFEGDSITDWWEAQNRANWDANFSGWKPADFGIAGERTNQVIWRLQNGELDNVNPKAIVLMIGTNNLGGGGGSNDDAIVEDISKGIKKVVDIMREKAPNAKILLLGIFARNSGGNTSLMPTIKKINEKISKFDDGKMIKYLDINDKLANPDGTLKPGMMRDGLHPTAQGYQVWADAMKPILTEWLGPRPGSPEAKTPDAKKTP